MFSFDLSDVPLEERMPKWDNFGRLKVWEWSRSLSESLVVMEFKMQKHEKIKSKKAFVKVKSTGCCF